MTGVLVSTLTARLGDELTEEDTQDYKRYIQRHNERRDTARRADKLVSLVGERNPNMEEELRIYVGKHPWKVAQLLAEAKKATFLGPKRRRTREDETTGESNWKTHKKEQRRTTRPTTRSPTTKQRACERGSLTKKDKATSWTVGATRHQRGARQGRVLKTSERCGKAHFLFSVSVLAFLNCFCFLLPGDLQHVL